MATRFTSAIRPMSTSARFHTVEKSIWAPRKTAATQVTRNRVNPLWESRMNLKLVSV